MSTARVLIKQGNSTYRFLRLETSSDGSLVVIVDRDPRPKGGSFELNSKDGLIVPAHTDNPDQLLPSGRFSIHTTGIVHRHGGGDRKNTIQIEPLHSLTKVSLIGFVSFPQISRLDPLDENKHRHDVAPILEFPEGISERITFVVEIGPKPQQPSTFGVSLHYELYSATIRVAPANFPAQLEQHFIHGMIVPEIPEKTPVDKATAELEFYQRIHGRSPFVFREDKGGAYVAMAVIPMAKTPKLTIGFDRPDLSIEAIPFEEGRAPAHKVRFWICDKGGHNKVEDLRRHIISFEFDAQS